MSTFNLNTSGLETYEIGATILALLADPTHPDDARTLEVRNILCGRALWFEHMERPEEAGTAIPIKPGYLWRDQVTVGREVQRVARRLGERMVAGRMGQLFLLPALDPNFKLPSPMKRASHGEAAKFVQEDAGQADAKNVLARIWRPSLAGHPSVRRGRLGRPISKASRPCYRT